MFARLYSDLYSGNLPVKNLGAQNPIEYPPKNHNEDAMIMTMKVQFDMMINKELQILFFDFAASKS